jgi:hypothetical protein
MVCVWVCDEYTLCPHVCNVFTHMGAYVYIHLGHNTVRKLANSVM